MRYISVCMSISLYVMNVCMKYLRMCGAYADSCFVCQIVAKKIVFFSYQREEEERQSERSLGGWGG